jgi:hypothetical protein
MDRLLTRGLWLVVMCLIAGTAMGGLVLLYSGLFQLISMQLQAGGIVLGAGVLLGVASWMLCKHSDDLIDRRIRS